MTRTHLMSHTHPPYSRWQGMRARCNNPAHVAYPRYGGRGIRVCARWDDFTAFIADVGTPPPNHELHRIDNDGDYEPGNCEWIEANEHRALPKSAHHREAIGAAHRGRRHSAEHARKNGLAHRADIDPEWLRAQHAVGRTINDIAAELALHRTTVSRALARALAEV